MSNVTVVAVSVGFVAFIALFCVLAVFVSGWFIVPALVLGFTPAVVVFWEGLREPRSV